MVMGPGDLENEAILMVMRFGAARCFETAAELMEKTQQHEKCRFVPTTRSPLTATHLFSKNFARSLNGNPGPGTGLYPREPLPRDRFEIFTLFRIFTLLAKSD